MSDELDNTKKNINQINDTNRLISNNESLSNNLDNIKMKINQNGSDSQDKKDDDIIKYSWLIKEKLTHEILIKKKEGAYECSICLEQIKLNDDINILKCGHIFHYKCIENLIDHHPLKCPYCRNDIQTRGKLDNDVFVENNDDYVKLDPLADVPYNTLPWYQ